MLKSVFLLVFFFFSVSVYSSESESGFEGYILPDGFEDFLVKENKKHSLIYEGQAVGSVTLQVLSDSSSLVIEKDIRRFEYSKIISDNLSGVINFNQNYSCIESQCNDIESFVFDMSDTDEIIVTAQTKRSNQRDEKTDSSYLSASSNQDLSAVVQYDFDVFDNSVQDIYTRASFEGDLSMGETYIHSDLDVISSGHTGNNTAINTLELIRDTQGYKVNGGVINMPFTVPGFTSSSKVVGLGIESVGRSSRYQSIVAKPMTYSASYNGTIEIYKEDVLLDVIRIVPGNNTIDTSSWPTGSYNVILKIKENFKDSERIVPFYKLSLTESDGYSYFVGLTENSDTVSFDEVNQSAYERGDLDRFVAGFKYTKNFGVGFTNAVSLITDGNMDYGIHEELNYNFEELNAYTSLVYLKSEGYGSISNVNLNLMSISIGATLDYYWYKDNQLLGQDNDTRGYYSLYADYAFRSNQTVSYSYNKDLYGSESHNVAYSLYNFSVLGFEGLDFSAEYSLYSVNNDEQNIRLSFTIPLAFGDHSKSSFYINHNSQSELEVSGDLYGEFNDNLSASVDVTGSESYQAIGTKVEMESDYFRSAITYRASDNGQSEKNELRVKGDGSVIFSGEDIAISSARDNAFVRMNVSEKYESDVDFEVDGIDKSVNKYIPLSNFDDYNLLLIQDKESGKILRTKPPEEKITLYPGDVLNFKPEIFEIIEVISIAKSKSGVPLVGYKVISDSGISYTDSQGSFSIQLSRDENEINFLGPKKQSCSVDLSEMKSNQISKQPVIVLPEVMCD